MTSKIVQLEKKYFIGIGAHTYNDVQKFVADINELKRRFFTENLAEIIPNRMDREVKVFYCNYEGDHTQAFTVAIGCEVSSLNQVPENMIGVEASKGKYAVFPVKGDFPQSLAKAWQGIWTAGLKRSFKCDFERYPENFDKDNNPNLEVYIGID